MVIGCSCRDSRRMDEIADVDLLADAVAAIALERLMALAPRPDLRRDFLRELLELHAKYGAAEASRILAMLGRCPEAGSCH